MAYNHPRITMDPGIFGGKPIIRGMRFRVCDVLSYLAGGDTPESLLEEFPFLEADDIVAALAFAAEVTEYIKGPEMLPKPPPETLGKHKIITIS
jgi:uncharacterized protein (DUF433 family)